MQISSNQSISFHISPTNLFHPSVTQICAKSFRINKLKWNEIEILLSQCDIKTIFGRYSAKVYGSLHLVIATRLALDILSDPKSILWTI